MPFKDPEVNRKYQREWARKWRRKNRKKHNETVKSSYERMKQDPNRHARWKAARREYYRNNREKIIEYSQKLRFGGNKARVYKRDNNRCQICEAEKKGKNILIHHIDGNGRGSKNPNNKLDNLILLCQSCHSVVHKFNKLKNNSTFKKLVRSLP